MHDVFQIREAAKHLALSKIFFNLSDNVDDHWFRKFEEYRDKYKIAISLYNFSYDEDGDGVDDLEEKTINLDLLLGVDNGSSDRRTRYKRCNDCRNSG